MGRSGGGHSGGGHHGGSSFHGGGSHRSYSHSSHSSYSSHSSGHSTHVTNNYYSYPRRRRYYHNNYYYAGPGHPVSTSSAGGAGCATAFLTFIVLFFVIIFVASCFRSNTGNGYVSMNEDVVRSNAEKFYDEHYAGREDIFLFYVAFSDSADYEIQQILYGDEASPVVGDTYDQFFDLYDNYYNDDVGIQIGKALNRYTDYTIGDVKKIKGQKFNNDFIYDDLGWIDSKSYLKDAAEHFHDETGVQFVVATVNYDDFEGVKNKTDNTKIIIVLISATALIGAGFGGYKWWKKKKELQIKENEQNIQILNTPLDQYNTINDLASKYDDDKKDK